MNIIIVTSVYAPYRGGQAAVAKEQAEGLVARGHAVTVLVPENKSLKNSLSINEKKELNDIKIRENEEEYLNGVRVIRISPLFTIGIAGYAPSVMKYIRDCDCVLCHYPSFGFIEWAVAAARARKIPYYVWYHFDPVGTWFKKIFFEIYKKLFNNLIIRRAEKIGTASIDYIRHSEISEYVDRCVEMPFGVNELFFSQIDPSSFLSKFNINTDHPYILFVAALDKAHYFKGLDRLLGAIMETDDIRLVICGDGNMRKYYEDFVGLYNMRDRVVFAGRVSDEELRAAYKGAYVTILPSIDKTEAFGIVLAESMSQGTPVIASDLPGVRSVAREGVMGLLVKPGNILDLREKIEYLFASPDVRKSMSHEAFQHASKHYRWPIHVEALERFLMSESQKR